MNTIQCKPKSQRTGKSWKSVNKTAVNGSPLVGGLASASDRRLNAFYSAEPVLSLNSLVQTKTISREPRDPRKPNDQYEPEAGAHSKSCPGRPFSRAVRNFFEPRFKHDFSDVKVHTCGSAVQMSKALKAQAFTYGNNIFFNQGKYNPGTSAGKQLLAHELTHVVQQQNKPFRIQRRQDEIIGCFRDKAEACLVHLHGSEKSALETARKLYGDYCVNLVHLNNYDCRLLRVEVNVSVPKKKEKGEVIKTFTCCADPNRILDESSVRAESNWKSWNRDPLSKKKAYKNFPGSWGCKNKGTKYHDCFRPNNECLTDPVKNAAQQAVIDFGNNKLRKAIDLCRGLTQEGKGKPKAIVAFHGNVDTPTKKKSLSIRSYLKKGKERKAAARFDGGTTADQEGLEFVFKKLQKENPELVKKKDVKNINPYIFANKDPDDFILVTKKEDFLSFIKLGQNVVLQSEDPPQDGSLSVVLKKDRYINIEAERRRPFGTRKAKEALDIQEKMGKKALKDVLGISQGIKSCPAKKDICPINICKPCP